MKTTLYDYCTRHGKNILLKEWHPEKNAPLTPETVTYGSRKKIRWLCEQGHEWEAAVYSRTGSGSGCPYCSGRRPLTGFNDLAATHSELTAQWHPVKNDPLTPDMVTAGSSRSVWWVCEKGHEWQAAVKSRAGGCGCPVCTNRRLQRGHNDLAATHPDLALQWHPEKNGSLTPYDVLAGTCRRVWWRCEKGHEWQSTVESRSGGAGCPVCAGKLVIPGENDLASRFPDIAGQWHREKNEPMTPDAVAPYSNRKVWWRCELGHEYRAAVSARTMGGTGCPYCTGKKVLAGFNDLTTLEPKIAAQWHPTLNGTLTPEMVTAGSHHKVWWECSFGHVWSAMVYSRTDSRKCGCPVCAGRIKPERLKRYETMMNGP